MLVDRRQGTACAGQARGARGRAGGFTLIELLITIMVAAVLATLAAPSFREFVATQKLRNVSFDLMAALTLARSEAISRNVTIDFKRTGSAWDTGWTVGEPDAPVMAQEAYKGLSITDSASLAAITFGRDGRATAGTRFTIAPDPVVSGVASRCVLIGADGMPFSRKGACS